MRTSSTVGFAVDGRDRARLDHLALVFGGGNRSAFLREAIGVMERFELVQEVSRVQVYGASRLAAAGLTREDIPALVERALTDPDPAAKAQAKRTVADLASHWGPPVREPSTDEDQITGVWAEVLDAAQVVEVRASDGSGEASVVVPAVTKRTVRSAKSAATASVGLRSLADDQ